MKKIIWIFGQSATGKMTLINNLLNGNKNTLSYLGLEYLKVEACENTITDDKIIIPKRKDVFEYNDLEMQESNEYFNRENAINRRACIMTDCLSFLQNNSDVLLIKGQDNDILPRRGDIIKYFLNYFGNNIDIDIEVYMLTVQDDNLWKSRIESKGWYKEFLNKGEVMQNMIKDRESQKHEKRVIDAFSVFNIPITFIDSGEGAYTILGDYRYAKKV